LCGGFRIPLTKTAQLPKARSQTIQFGLTRRSAWEEVLRSRSCSDWIIASGGIRATLMVSSLVAPFTRASWPSTAPGSLRPAENTAAAEVELTVDQLTRLAAIPQSAGDRSADMARVNRWRAALEWLGSRSGAASASCSKGTAPWSGP
jgi:hypothetical protein